MQSPDDAKQRLEELQTEFAAFCEAHGSVSEADTRAKVIDRILVDVCSWPEADISREDRAGSGFMDYLLSIGGHPAVAVEAKREGIPFILPSTMSQKSFKLSGTLVTDPNVRDAVNQVRGYCDEAGIRFAIATNGYAWIVFRAVRDDQPWRQGYARVFPSLRYISDNFTDFWNLLSYTAILGGSLEEEFGGPPHHPRNLIRVIDRLFNSDLPLQRNRLHAHLEPVIRSVFADIAEQDQLDVLKSCYVHDRSMRIVAKDLDLAITDSIPQFLKDEGTRPIHQDEHSGGGFERVLTRAIERDRGELFLILGGIGCGKTTFLKRYQKTVGKALLDSRTIWFHVDFFEAPLDPRDLEQFLWRAILKQLRERYVSPHLETRRNIKRVFRDDIAALKETSLRFIREDTEDFEKALNPYLEHWQQDLSVYVPGLLRTCKPRRDLAVVFFIDNVDQLSPAYQAQIFLLAQRVTRLVGSATIVTLREESYYTASVQRTFTAYSNRKFHIASPRFRPLIRRRIGFALDVLGRAPEEMQVFLSSGIELDTNAIKDFLRIVQESIFEQNPNIARFIEAICFGNMRQALQMFTTFLISGATDVEKMLHIYRRDGSYYVAFHEFVKSIMLGDRRYYKEEQSPILNLFECGSQRNSSHFTALRLINVLLRHRSESTREGRGYVEIVSLAHLFDDLFGNREDFIATIDRLVQRQLVEVNTRSTESIVGATHARVTSAGWYYARYLSRTFSYLDLVLQDTPLNDVAVAERLWRAVDDVDNLGDREEIKFERMEVRFRRVEEFISYLQDEETKERVEHRLEENDAPIAEPIVHRIREKYERQREWIRRRLAENRERFADEQSLSDVEDEVEILVELESVEDEDASEDERDEGK